MPSGEAPEREEGDQWPTDNPLELLRQYLDEFDDSEFSPWMNQVTALVSNLANKKILAGRLPDEITKGPRP